MLSIPRIRGVCYHNGRVLSLAVEHALPAVYAHTVLCAVECYSMVLRFVWLVS